jgi:hypothetical protein
MGLFSRLAGTMTSFFQIGGPGGAGWSNVGATAIEAKDPTDTVDVNVRGAAPLVPNDLVTKQYSDTAFKPIIVTAQFNGGSALPANSASEHFYVVTTNGANASIGDLVWDNGTGTGTATVIPAPIGGEIMPTAAFSGGSISFVAFQNYVWNGSAWVELTSGSTPGASQVVQFALGTATASSVTSIPTGATILRATLLVTTPYTAGTTIEIGSTGVPSLLQATTDNDPEVDGTYDAPQLTNWNAASVVTATIAGAPAAGAATVMVEYVATPNP